MREERIFIVIEHDNNSIYFSVGGGLKDNGQLESFNAPKECLEEIKNRVIYTLMEIASR